MKLFSSVMTMPILLDRMPFTDEPDEVIVRGERIRIRPNQVIIWVSLSARQLLSQNPAVAPFPAILDTGHANNFSIHATQLARWFGMRTEGMELLKIVRERDRQVPLHAAWLWVYPNLRGDRHRLAECPAYRLSIPMGIAVHSGDDGFPRLPLVGIRTLVDNDLVFKIRGRRRQATLRSRRSWWPFD